MNSNSKKIAVLSAMALMGSMGSYPDMPVFERKKINEWERKKCKSCKLFPCNDNRHKYKSSPLAQACEKYSKRNN